METRAPERPTMRTPPARTRWYVASRRTGRIALVTGTLAIAWLPRGHGSGRAFAAPPATAPPASVPAPTKPAALAIQDIRSPTDLRAPFNLGRGKVRIVAFFSPMCSHCRANAEALQKVVLAKLDSPDLAVHVVWMPVSQADSRELIPSAAAVLPDPRVRHYWDGACVLNPPLRDAVGLEANVRLYDIALLYGAATGWDAQFPPPGFWMHEFRGAPGPLWNAATFATQVGRALHGEPLDTPKE
jgi:hypothetical protein